MDKGIIKITWEKCNEADGYLLYEIIDDAEKTTGYNLECGHYFCHNSKLFYKERNIIFKYIA